MKKAIVTGSTGFIGSVFTRFLLDRGIEVLALGRKKFESLSPYKKKNILGSSYITIEMSDIRQLADECSRVGWEAGDDCVFFNLAWSGVDRMSDLDVRAQTLNVLYSVNAFDVAVEIGCRRFVQVGTMEESFTQKYLNLDHRVDKAYNRHVVYSVAKMAARFALDLKARQTGIHFNYVLHSHVMGPEDDKDSFLQETLKKFLRKDSVIMSSGEQLFDVISVYDCALGYYLICESGLPGEEYWVGSGDPRCLKDYVERMHVLYPSGKDVLFGSLPYNDVILDKDVFSIEKLVQHTGYKPRMTFEETVVMLRESFTGL